MNNDSSVLIGQRRPPDVGYTLAPNVVLSPFSPSTGATTDKILDSLRGTHFALKAVSGFTPGAPESSDRIWVCFNRTQFKVEEAIDMLPGDSVDVEFHGVVMRYAAFPSPSKAPTGVTAITCFVDTCKGMTITRAGLSNVQAVTGSSGGGVASNVNIISPVSGGLVQVGMVTGQWPVSIIGALFGNQDDPVLSRFDNTPRQVSGAGVGTQILGWDVWNRGAADAYILFWDKATLPVAGVDTPFYRIYLPAGSFRNFLLAYQLQGTTTTGLWVAAGTAFNGTGVPGTLPEGVIYL